MNLVKHLILSIRFAFIFLISALTDSAVAFSNSPECTGELEKLIVPSLTHAVFSRSAIKAEISDNSDEVYSARLFVAGNNPDNLDKQVTIGWVNLNIRSMKAYEVTTDENNKMALKVNATSYKRYVDKCILDNKKENAEVALCGTLDRSAEKSEALIPGDRSEHKVIGRGRLQFYSAPDEKCMMPDTFILPNERVDAHSEFNGYVSVDYFNLKTGSTANGWVKSNRLVPTGFGIAPHQP
jgi:hypothetical protein